MITLQQEPKSLPKQFYNNCHKTINKEIIPNSK